MIYERVAIIEQPDGSMLDTPVPVAHNGGAKSVLKQKVSSQHLLPIARKIQKAATGSSQVCVAEPMEACSPIQGLHSCLL